MVQETGSKIVFLGETRQKIEKVRRLRNRLGLKGCAGISSEGMSGGLALLWDESVHVEVKGINERCIDSYVRLSLSDPLWHVAFVHGEPRAENRHIMCSLLKDLKQTSTLPWLVLGDFNETMWQFEHFSKRMCNEPYMQAFRDTLNLCELSDIGFKGEPYTYDNKREGWNNVKVRLDCVVADDKWRDLFANPQVEHMACVRSDHCPTVLCFNPAEQIQNHRKCLQYEIFWEREPESSEVIQDSWASTGDKSDLSNITRSLGKVMTELHSWSKRKCKNVGTEIEKGRKQLAALLENNTDSSAIRLATNQLSKLFTVRQCFGYSIPELIG